MSAQESNLKVQVLSDLNLHVFSDTLSEDIQEASRSSHALAVKAASDSYHPYEQNHEWFQRYVDVMGALGWVAVKTDVRNVTETGLRLELGDLFAKGLEAGAEIVSGNVRKGFQDLGLAIVEALSKPENYPLLDVRTREDDRKVISLAKCEQSAGGQVTMLVSAVIDDQLPQRNGKTLFVNWKREGGAIYACGAGFSFSRRTYARAEGAIEARIHANALKILADIPLA
ncbi:hypothetical protein E2H86_02895 [Pseudomonas putida]|uniref:hypothetical protein n=1 Tax=Pseudomonas putida group TaxID=136845 RepID=UPI001059D587|nr:MULTISPECIES: hypothetical protein [Pseudomonas putida group]MBF8745997.1 hypothetical protein [Pseudomonas monteilii]TDJ78565.1 hypothetical protein E2H86_02895 [Pseudomonas putida]